MSKVHRWVQLIECDATFFFWVFVRVDKNLNRSITEPGRALTESIEIILIDSHRIVFMMIGIKNVHCKIWSTKNYRHFQGGTFSILMAKYSHFIEIEFMQRSSLLKAEIRSIFVVNTSVVWARWKGHILEKFQVRTFFSNGGSYGHPKQIDFIYGENKCILRI